MVHWSFAWHWNFLIFYKQTLKIRLFSVLVGSLTRSDEDWEKIIMSPKSSIQIEECALSPAGGGSISIIKIFQVGWTLSLRFDLPLFNNFLSSKIRPPDKIGTGSASGDIFIVYFLTLFSFFCLPKRVCCTFCTDAEFSLLSLSWNKESNKENSSPARCFPTQSGPGRPTHMNSLYIL